MTGRGITRWWRALVVLAIASAVGSTALVGTAGSGVLSEAPKVLILDTTLDEGSSPNEESVAVDLGFAVDVVTEGEWAAMSAAQFAEYRAIVFGDPDCESDDATILAAPLANVGVWGPVVTGNAIVHTFDPIAHLSEPGTEALMSAGIAYATEVPGKTGLYLSTSCYDGPAVAQMLSGFAPSWTYVPEEDWDDVDCNTIYFVNAFPPALSGLTEEELSDWGCSTHGFFSAWPSDFTVLAVISESIEGNSEEALPEEGQATGSVDGQEVADDFVGDGIIGSPVLLVRPALADPEPAVLEPTFTG